MLENIDNKMMPKDDIEFKTRQERKQQKELAEKEPKEKKLPKNMLNKDMFDQFIAQVAALYKLGYSWTAIGIKLKVSQFRLRELRKRFPEELKEAVRQSKLPAKTDKSPISNEPATLEDVDDIIAASNISSKIQLCEVLDKIINDPHQNTVNITNSIKLLAELQGYNNDQNNDNPNYIVSFVEYIPNEFAPSRNANMSYFDTTATKVSYNDTTTTNSPIDTQLTALTNNSSATLDEPLTISSDNKKDVSSVIDGDSVVVSDTNMSDPNLFE